MALFTDGTISTLEDLGDHDSAVLEVAATESINLTRKLALVQDEIGVELSALLPRIDSFDQQFYQQITSLANVVVTPPLRLWHIFHTLALTYRDAYYSQYNERYQGKWKEYVELAKWAAEKVMQTGVGVAVNPVPQAGAPIVTVVEGNLAAGVYFVSAAWLNGSGEEGSAAPALSVSMEGGTTMEVRMTAAPANARGWNAYLGTDAGAMLRQNGQPLGLEDAWVQPSPPATTGPGPSGGQRPSYLRALPRVLQRG